MAAPDFLQFHCNNTDKPPCPLCPRDFVLPINAIEGIYKHSDGSAIVLIKGTHYCPGPTCENALRFIHTTMTWTALIAALDGKVQNCGNITKIESDYLPKG